MASTSIRGMNRALDLKETLAEGFWKELREKEARRREHDFTVEVLEFLQDDDPDWFEANVAATDTYVQIVEKVVKRVIWLEGEKHKARMHAFIMTVTPAFFEKRA